MIIIVYLQAKHSSPNNASWGVDGETGTIVDMKDYGIWEPYAVKAQTYKTALEVRKSHQYFCSTYICFYTFCPSDWDQDRFQN